MPPKKRTESSSSSNNIFQYNNTVELTFKPDSNKKLLVKTKTVGDSSDEDDAPILKKKKGRRRGKKDTCSSSSSSSSDTSFSSSDSENGKPGDELKKYDIHEICDDDFDELPRPLTPPPSNTNAPTSGPSRQAKKLSRTVGEKMRYLQFLQKQDVASPVAATPNVFDVGDNYGSPNNFQHKMTVRIRTRNGVRRFQMKMNETFEEIFNNLATMHEVTTDVISLSFTDGLGNLQMLKFTDTPSKVNLSVADIIDCVVVNRTTIDESVEMSENVVNIKIQGSESKSVKHFKALKNKSLGRIMQLYAEFRQLPLSKLKFFFDGEKILPEQTPNDLDMDDENAVDVKLI